MTAIRLCSVLCGCYEQEELTEYSHMGRLFIRLRGRSVPCEPQSLYLQASALDLNNSPPLAGHWKTCVCT